MDGSADQLLQDPVDHSTHQEGIEARKDFHRIGKSFQAKKSFEKALPRADRQSFESGDVELVRQSGIVGLSSIPDEPEVGPQSTGRSRSLVEFRGDRQPNLCQSFLGHREIGALGPL